MNVDRRDGNGKVFALILVLLMAGFGLYAGYDVYDELLFGNSQVPEEFAASTSVPSENRPEQEPDTNRVSIEEVTRESRARATDAGRVVTPLERKSDELLVAFLDVGQGDAVFLQFPDGTNILLDVGEGDYERHDVLVNAADNIILPYLEENNITELDYFVSSHPHSDHIGAAHDLIRELSPDRAILSGRSHTTTTYEMMMEALFEQQVPVNSPVEADGTLNTGDELSIPEVEFRLMRAAPEHRNLNEASLTFRLQYGDVSFLFTGDTEDEGEAELVEEWGSDLDSTVLKVGHHGSRTSSNPEFLRTVSPRQAIIMVGGYNTYGHPHPSVVSRLEEHGATVHRTDEHGSIMMATDGETLRYYRSSELSAVR